jgi:hypothetical protein
MERNYKEELDLFHEKTEKALRLLFDTAKEKNELQFALSLSPEFRGEQGPGWCTAHESMRAFDEYMTFISLMGKSSFTIRIALSFYSNLAEASGFYEVPKNMLRVCDGEKYNLWPFQTLVEKHKITGNSIAPNSNKILKDLTGHAITSGFDNLAEVFRDAFDPDLRNGYAHADYIVWHDGIRLRKRNGGYPRVVSWEEFECLFNKGVNFFNLLKQLAREYQNEYKEPKTIKGQMNNEPIMDWTIHCDVDKGSFSISNGKLK